jgi:hypothetical protein
MDMSRENSETLNPQNAMALVRMARRSTVSADLKAVRIGICRELRTLLSDVLREPTPNGMAELLKQLDQPTVKRSGR